MRVLVAVVVLCLVACSTPKLTVRAPPSLPNFRQSPPSKPDTSLQTSAPYSTAAKTIAAREPPDLRESRLAISVTEASDGAGPSWSALAAALVPTAASPLGDSTSSANPKLTAIDGLLPETLISRGYTKVIYPPALRRILARTNRTLPRDSDGERTTSLVGSLESLAEVGGTVPADYLLAIEVVQAGPTKLEVETRVKYAPADLAQYSEARNKYAAEVQKHEQAVLRLIRDYRSEYDLARRAYEKDDGEYEEEAAKATRAEYERWDSTAAGAEARLARMKVPPPAEQLVEAAERLTETKELDAAHIGLRAKLVELNTGETFWLVLARSTQQDLLSATRLALEAIFSRMTGSERTEAP